MAKNYEIVIRNETEGSDRSPISGSNASKKDTTSSGGGIAPWRKNIAKGIAVTNTYIKPFADQLITQKVSTVELRTGAQELEDKLSFGYQMGQKAFGFVESVAVGALVGNLPGAILGGIMSLATMAVDYSNKQQKIDLQRSVENIGLQYMNIRAGGSVASFSGSRTSNH